jgi:hypothetical protein
MLDEHARCETCRWWERLPPDEPAPDYGLCQCLNDYTHETDTCGEHAPKEKEFNG